MVIEPSFFIIPDLNHNKGETESWVGHSVSGIFYIISSVKKWQFVASSGQNGENWSKSDFELPET